MVTSLADLSGEWRLTRVIEDARAGERLTLEGRAVFRRKDEGWIYEETGRLSAPGRPTLEATRTYLYRDLPGGAEVLFADGRPFHRFHWADAGARHWCDPDTYDVRYDFAAWPRWRAEWRVSGPRKDYVLVSDYERP